MHKINPKQLDRQLKCQLDHSVYPDLARPPTELPTIEARADYLHRICAAWDFGIHPTPATFALIATWQDVFDRFPIPTSPAYHALRAWFGWAPVAHARNVTPPRLRWQESDRLEGRPLDPCADSI